MNLDVTVGAVRVLRVQVMLRTSRLVRAHAMRRTMTSQTELRDAARNQQPRIRRTVRCVTSDAAISLDRGVLVNERPLLVSVALDAGGVRAGGESRLFELKAAVWIVAIAAPHRAFQHLVMERQVELVFGFAVTTKAELWFAVSQQLDIGETGLLRIRSRHKDVRGRELAAGRRRVSGVTVGTADVVAPVFAAAEVVVLFTS